MERERIITRSTTYSCNLAASRAESLRINKDMEKVVRVYEDGKIGVAACVGDEADETLTERAKKALCQGIPYPCSLTEHSMRHEDGRASILEPKDFLKAVSRLAERLSKAYPDFIFSNKVMLGEEETFYTNSKGTDLSYRGNYFVLDIVIKAKSSANIMDLYYGVMQSYYNEDAIVEDIGKLLNVYNKKLPLPEEELPVILSVQEAAPYALREMAAEGYMSGTSLLKGRLGEKVFNEKFSLLTDRAPRNRGCYPFFDAEGTEKEGDKFYFVKEGVFEGLATCKRTAQQFSLPLSGTAASSFDSVPAAGFGGVTVASTHAKLSDIVKGKAVYVAVTSGGDMTPDGTLGLPVMLAYLYEDGKLVGALPEFSLSGSLFDVFGKDFMGAAENDLFSFAGKEKVVVTKFKLNRG